MKVQNIFLVFGKKMKMLKLFAIFNFLIIIVTGSHFRGGTISWRYLGPPNKVMYVFLNHVFYTCSGAVVAVIVWLLDLQQPMQSVPITTDDMSSNLDQGEVYNIM